MAWSWVFFFEKFEKKNLTCVCILVCMCPGPLVMNNRVQSLRAAVYTLENARVALPIPHQSKLPWPKFRHITVQRKQTAKELITGPFSTFFFSQWPCFAWS